MENQAGTSSSGTEHSATNSKLALTEENLDYLLRQEYTLSKMCFDADQMTLEVLGEADSPQDSNNSNQSDEFNAVEEDTKQHNEAVDNANISDEKMVVGQEDNSEFALPGSSTAPVKDENLSMKSLKDVFNLNLNPSEFVSLFDFCQTEYGENAEYMWKEKLQEVWQAKMALEENASGTTPAQEASDDTPMETGKVSKEPNNLNIENVNNCTLNVNCVNSKIQLENKWKNFSSIKYFADEEMEIPSEIPFPDSVNNGTYQSLSSLIESTHLKEPAGLNKASEFATSTQSDVELTLKKNTDDVSSVRDLALASSSSHDIEYIDADEHFIAVHYYKTDSEDSKKNKTLSSNKTCGNMIDLEYLLNTFTKSTTIQRHQYFNFDVQVVSPSKSSLKRKISQISSKKNTVKKSALKFTSVTVFYFERSQGFSSIPTKGGSTLGMAGQHFYISTIPIDEYEHRKAQKELPSLRTGNIIYHRKGHAREKAKNVQALNLSQRIELLESAEVEIELKEEVDCAHIRSSRASAGCDCKDYCDPEICCCSLSGIECQVDRPNFPCGCSRENCRNVVGRNEYNHSKVRTHFAKTMRKITSEGKGRTSKRKQASPTKVTINDSDIPDDINMVEI